ncbi:MAG: MBL fold metallo-hydrolase [Planctomycetota bacterium]
MRLRFLGTGTSAGVPSIGIDPISDDPRDVRLRTSAVLEFTDPTGQERVILIDAGPDLRQQAMTAGLTRLDAILFTHNHVDHTWGLDEVRRFNVMMQRPIDLYADDKTLQHLRRVYQHIFEAHANVQKSFVATVIARRIQPFRSFELYGLKITPIELLHGRLPILGFRFDVASRGLFAGGAGDPDGSILPFAYCTDVSAIPPDTWPYLDGLEVLVLDALRRRKHPTHFTLDQSVNVAERVGAGKTFFVHMNHELVHAEVEAELPENVRLAYDGLVVGE